MDDRELEGRLRTHLHQRLDGAAPSPELTASVQQVLRTQPRSVGLPTFQLGSRSFSWSAVGVVGLIAILGLGAIRFGNLLLEGAPRPSPTAEATFPTIAERSFMAIAPGGASPSRADRDRATEVLMERLVAFGLKGTTSERFDAIEFTLSLDGPPDSVIRNVLAATGDLQLVPLPESYRDGTHTAEIGEPLPTAEPALFGWEGVGSVSRTFDVQDRSVMSMDLLPAAAQAFGEYTATHVGESFAIVIDGEVAVLPMISEPILGGEIQVSSGGLPGSDEAARFDEAVAILRGGLLPVAWRGAIVLEIISRDEAIQAARALGQGGVSAGIESADLSVLEDGSRLIPVWRVVLDGEFRECIPGPSGDPSCLTAARMEFVLDAVNGDQLSSRSLDE